MGTAGGVLVKTQQSLCYSFPLAGLWGSDMSPSPTLISSGEHLLCEKPLPSPLTLEGSPLLLTCFFHSLFFCLSGIFGVGDYLFIYLFGLPFFNIFSLRHVWLVGSAVPCSGAIGSSWDWLCPAWGSPRLCPQRPNRPCTPLQSTVSVKDNLALTFFIII